MNPNSLILGDLFTTESGMRGWCTGELLRCKTAMYWNAGSASTFAVSLMDTVTIEGRTFDIREALRWIRDGLLM